MKRVLWPLMAGCLLAGCDDEKTVSPSQTVAAPPPAAAAPAPAPAPPPAPSTNQPPRLVVKFTPETPGGRVPHTVRVNMCPSTDPDGDRLIFEYKFGGTGHGANFHFFCRNDHTYTAPGSYKAFFCVHDDFDHRVCHNQLIVVTP